MQEYISDTLYKEISENSNVLTGQEYRDLVCGVAQVASDMVVKTLGPYGSTTVIDDGTGFTYPSKDGWACLSRLQFTDPTYNSIFQMLKKISFNSVTSVGDGTTTAMVAANNFLRGLYQTMSAKNSGFRQADFIAAMKNIAETLEEKLTNNPYVQKVDPEGDFEEIYRIAYVATNGNEEFAKMIQSIYKETKNPNISVTLEPIPETKFEIQKGYKFGVNVIDYNAYVNDESGIINFKNENQLVVIFDHNITYQKHKDLITTICGVANKKNMRIIIMAPYIDEIISNMIDNSIQGLIRQGHRPNIMMVQIPLSLDIHKKSLIDLGVLTNANIFTDPLVQVFNMIRHNQLHPDDAISDTMLELPEYKFDTTEDVVNNCLGTIRSLVIDKRDAFLQDYESTRNEGRYKDILAEAKKEYEDAKKAAAERLGGTLDKEFLFTQMRWIKLTGYTGVIKVGGASDIQQHCDKDSLDDAVLACRSAYENGYVRGMNLELLHILSKMMDRTDYSDYEKQIIEMLYNSFYMTSLQVIENKWPIDANFNSEKRHIHMNDYDSDTPLSLMTMSMNNEEVLGYVIESNEHYDYNLRTETCNPCIMNADMSDTHICRWEIVNSVQTDIEILRAVVNVLTTVITSNQFLSVTRRFDAKSTGERALKNKIAEEERFTAAKVETIIGILKEEKLVTPTTPLTPVEDEGIDIYSHSGTGHKVDEPTVIITD